MSTKRPRRERETADYLSMVRRMIRGAGRRVAAADEVDLRDLLTLQAAVDEAIQAAVDGQRDMGRSWEYIAQATGKSRQAAQQRWGR